jgi:nucleoside-diphosphate-sugar epimerase
MKLFVTGGTGFIGSHFIRAAQADGHTVLALRRSAASVPVIALPQEPQWLTKAMNLVTPSDLKDCDILVHIAAAGVDPAENEWEKLFQTNVIESLKLWLVADSANVRRFVIFGSCFEYGKSGESFDFIPPNAPLLPIGPYSASKAAATLAAISLATERNWQLTVARPFHVFGEGESEARFWPSLRKAAIAGEDFPMTKGEQVRDFVPVAEVAGQVLDACSNPPPPGQPEIRHIGTGNPQTLRAFAEDCWLQWKAQGKLVFGAKSYRQGEVMRFVPQVDHSIFSAAVA